MFYNVRSKVICPVKAELSPRGFSDSRPESGNNISFHKNYFLGFEGGGVAGVVPGVAVGCVPITGADPGAGGVPGGGTPPLAACSFFFAAAAFFSSSALEAAAA